MTLAFIDKNYYEGLRCTYYATNGTIALSKSCPDYQFLSFAKGEDGRVRIVLSSKEFENASFRIRKDRHNQKLCFCRRVADSIFSHKKTSFRLIADGKFDDADVYKISIDE